jgi:hypothetical protein
MVSKTPSVLENLSISTEKQECSYFLFRIVFTFARGDPLTSLDPVPKSVFDIGSINDWQNSLHPSKKVRIVIGMETSKFIV